MNVARAVLRFGYVPLMLLGVNGTALWLIAAGRPQSWLLVLIASAIALSFGAERLRPYRPDWNRSHDDLGRDVWHALVNEAANLASVATLPVWTSALGTGRHWPSAWPFAAQVLLAVLVLDAGVSLVHWASHRTGWLWRFHAVHHSVRRMYGFNGLMKHPVHQSIEMLAGSLPLVAVGLPEAVAVAMAACTVVQLLVQHSNVDVSVGPLRRLLATSEAHRFHHVRWPGQGDVNFGLFTTIWDHLLGTFAYRDGVRFSSDDLGIADRPDYPTRYVAQLIEPFRRAHQ